MSHSRLQALQWIWVGLGLAYNGLSWGLIQLGRTALAPTDPVLGAGFVLIYAAVVVAGAAGAAGLRRLYKFALPVLTLLLIVMGVAPHLAAWTGESGLSGYASPAAFWAALGVNLYGAGVFLTATWAAYRRP